MKVLPDSLLSLYLLGPIRISYNQQPEFKLQSRNALTLLIYLVVEHTLGHPTHQRQALMELFWPDTQPQSAQVNLRQTLYKLRGAIPTVFNQQGDQVSFVLADRQTVSLNPDTQFDLDVAEFMRLIASTKPAQLTQAVKLYRGNFLTDFSLPDSNSFEMWAEIWREKLRQKMLSTLAVLADLSLSSGNHEGAERYARRQLEIDNLREQGYYQLMMALSQSHRGYEAINHYQAYSRTLQIELNLSPSKEITALAESIRHGEENASIEQNRGLNIKHITGENEASSTPVQLSEDSPPEIPNNLPLTTAPIIGRQTELSALNQLLADPRTRLITITGPGGVGKTRLSLAVAKHQLTVSTFEDGIYFVRLARLSESERIVSIIAESIQLRLQQGEKQLLAYLRSKKLLLVLDNFEHLLEGSELLTRILQAAPQVQILVTSRERLHLTGEQIYPIHGLLVNDQETIENARHLFVQAAQRIRPDFQQTSENRSTLSHICKIVEGNPLALELAAAWVDLLTPQDIAVEIQRSIDFLETSLRDVPDRHRNMRAVFDTSWQNLSTNSQQILAQVSVFYGGFTRQAAQAIAQASLRDLAVLVDKSLLRFDLAEDRYTIHELLRQYIATKQSQADVLDRHRDYYFDWLFEQSVNLIGENLAVTLTLIEKEMDNIRAAINYAVCTRELDGLESVIRGLGQYYVTQNTHQEGVLFFGHLLTKLSQDPNTPPRILFWLFSWQINMLSALGRESEAWQKWPQCQALLAKLALEHTDIRAEQAFSDYVEAFHLYIRQPTKSRQLFQRSYELWMGLDNRFEAGYALLGIARAARNQGDLDVAQASIAEGLALFQILNDKFGTAEAQRILGALLGLAGRYAEAERIIQDGIVLTREMNHVWELANGGFSKLRMVYFFSGRFEDGLAPNAEYQLLSEEHGYTWGVVESKIAQGLLDLHLGRYLEARELGETAVHLAQNEAFLCEALILLTQANIAMGEVKIANRHLDECVSLCPTRLVGTSLFIAGNHLYQSLLAAIQQQLAIAWDHLQTELMAAKERNAALSLSNAVAVAAYLKAIEGDNVSSLELYSLAQQHPFVANSKWFEDVIGQKIMLATQNLNQETVQAAQLRGKILDLWEETDNLLTDLHAQFSRHDSNNS